MAWQAACPRCAASIGADTRTCPACGADLSRQVVLLTEGELHRSAPATVVTTGGGRHPGRVLVGGAVVVALVLAFLSSLGGDGGGEAGDDRGGEQAATTSTLFGGVAPPIGPVSGGHRSVTARPGRLIAGADPPLLLVDDGSLALVDLATGEIRHPGTPVPVDLDADLLPRDGAVVFVDRQGGAHALSPDLGSIVADLGAVTTIPAGAPDRVWLSRVIRLPGAGVEVEERTVAGDVVTEPVALLPQVIPMAGVDDGLLLQSPGGIYLLPSGGGRAERVAGGQVLGAGGGTVARYDCDEALDCRVHLTTTDDGRDLVPEVVPREGAAVAAPRLMPGEAEFSPDGSLLAVSCACNDGEGIAVVHVASGDVVLEAPGLQAPQWDPDGRWLFGTRAGTVFVWPAEGGDLAPLDVALQGARLLAALPSA